MSNKINVYSAPADKAKIVLMKCRCMANMDNSWRDKTDEKLNIHRDINDVQFVKCRGWLRMFLGCKMIECDFLNFGLESWKLQMYSSANLAPSREWLRSFSINKQNIKNLIICSATPLESHLEPSSQMRLSLFDYFDERGCGVQTIVWSWS